MWCFSLIGMGEFIIQYPFSQLFDMLDNQRKEERPAAQLTDGLAEILDDQITNNQQSAPCPTKRLILTG